MMPICLFCYDPTRSDFYDASLASSFDTETDFYVEFLAKIAPTITKFHFIELDNIVLNILIKCELDLFVFHRDKSRGVTAS